MFLSTLGLHTDRRVTEFVRTKTGSAEGSVIPTKDQRGTGEATHAINHQDIINHVNSYHPVISHYERQKALNRR